MELKESFEALAKKYGLSYRYQEFKNCFGGCFWIYTYSLYNESGCFTVHCLPQRLELDCYFASHFSEDRERLCEKRVNIYDIEKCVWAEKQEIWTFKSQAFSWGYDEIIKTLLEIADICFQRDHEFAGLKLGE